MTATSTRRAILAGAASLPALTIQAIAVANPDAKLLALGKEQEDIHALLSPLEARMDSANAIGDYAGCQAAEDEFSDCMDAMWEIADEIVAIPAHTAAGMLVKARSLRLCAGDQDMADGCEAAWNSIVADIERLASSGA